MTVPWTNEHVELLRRLAAAGCSASEIGGEVGVSRSAVIGKAHRLKLQLAGRPNPGGKLTRTTGKVKQDGTARTPAWMLRVNGPEAEAVELPTEPKRETEVAFAELNETLNCRWPTGHLLYCGGERVKGYPYCAWHCQMSYRRPE